jgi:hypothetical protein
MANISHIDYAYVLFKAGSKMGRSCEEVAYKTLKIDTIKK